MTIVTYYRKAAEWNTGRCYAAEGQIVAAVFVADHIDGHGDRVGTLYFCDYTRGILGAYPNTAFTNRDIKDHVLQARTMALYDKGGYEGLMTHDWETLWNDD